MSSLEDAARILRDLRRHQAALGGTVQLTSSTIGEDDSTVGDVVADAVVSNDAVPALQDDVQGTSDDQSALSELLGQSSALVDAELELAAQNLAEAQEQIDAAGERIDEVFVKAGDASDDAKAAGVKAAAAQDAADQATTASQQASDAASSATSAAQQASSDAAAAKSTADSASSAASSANQAALDAAGLAASKGKTIVQVSAPSGSNADPANLWIDISTDANGKVKNTPNRYNPSTSKWEPITDQKVIDAASTAASANQAATAASSAAATAQQKANDAASAAATAKTTADNAASSASQAQQTASAASQQAGSAASQAQSAITAAGGAQSTADAAKQAALDAAGVAAGKGAVYTQPTAPNPVDPNGLWLDSDDGNKPYAGVAGGRTNLATNPRAVGGTGWTNGGFGTGGVATQSFPAAAGVANDYGSRVTWSTAASGGGHSSALGSMSVPLSAGQPITVSVWVRSNQALPQVTIRLQPSAATSNYVAIPANTWTRLSFTYTPSSNGSLSNVEARIVNLAGTANGLTWDATRVLIEQGSSLGDYFDGASPGASWTGAANNSSSTYAAPVWVPVQDQAIVAAAQAAAEAQLTANSKPLILSGTSAPSGTAPQGSTWFRTDGSGNIIGQWQQTAAGNTGSTWTLRAVTSEVIANLDVGKLTASSAAILDAVVQKLAAATANIQTANVANLFVTDGATMKQAVIDYLFANVVQAHQITADMLAATAIDGLTITGATIRSAASGERVEMLGTRFDVYNSNNVNVGKIRALPYAAAVGIILQTAGTDSNPVGLGINNIGGLTTYGGGEISSGGDVRANGEFYGEFQYLRGSQLSGWYNKQGFFNANPTPSNHGPSGLTYAWADETSHDVVRIGSQVSADGIPQVDVVADQFLLRTATGAKTALSVRPPLTGAATYSGTIAANSSTTLTVTFPEGQFFDAPTVNANGSNSRVTIGINAVSAQSVTFALGNWTSSATSNLTVYWTATPAPYTLGVL